MIMIMVLNFFHTFGLLFIYAVSIFEGLNEVPLKLLISKILAQKSLIS